MAKEKQGKKSRAIWDSKIRIILGMLHTALDVDETTYVESLLDECTYLTPELEKLGLENKVFELTDEALTLEMTVQNSGETSIEDGSTYILARREEREGTYVIGARYEEGEPTVYIGRYELPCMDMELLYDPDEEYRANMAKALIRDAVSRGTIFARFTDILDREIAMVERWAKGGAQSEGEDPSTWEEKFTASLSEDEMDTVLLCVMLGMFYYGQDYWELAYSESAVERALHIVEYTMDIVKVLDDDTCPIDNDTLFVDSPELTKMYAVKGMELCKEADTVLRACAPQSGKGSDSYGKS